MISVLAERVGPRPERQYLCRRCESEGHFSRGSHLGITARVSQRRHRATKEKPRCHHFYNGEETWPLTARQCTSLGFPVHHTAQAVKSDERLIGQGHGKPFPSGFARTVGLMGTVFLFIYIFFKPNVIWHGGYQLFM